MLRDEIEQQVDAAECESLRDYEPIRDDRKTVLVGESAAIRAVLDVVERIATRDLTVLVTGETGTGKELIARLVHEKSGRRSGPFVRVNCGAIPPSLAESELFGHVRGAFTGAHKSHRGYFGMADGGTLLLDEVEALPREVQPKVLRALEDGEIQTVGRGGPRRVDARVVACTNVNLEEGVSEGWFRGDLYYRLAVVGIELPPLRERRGDIGPLAEHFARAAEQRFRTAPVTLAPGLLAALEVMAWPGNVRQLEHVISTMVALANGGVLGETLLPGRMTARSVTPCEQGARSQHATLRERMASIERGLIREVLASCDDNRSEAARRLGVRRTTLLDRMRRLGLRSEEAPCAESDQA